MTRSVSIVTYNSPDLIPARLKKLGVSLAGSRPDLLKLKIAIYSSILSLPSDRITYGAVLYNTPDLIPANMLKSFLVQVSDTFNRADSAVTLGNAETGQAWVAVSGTWGISSNRAYSASNADGDKATVDAGIADSIFNCTINGDLNGADYSVPDVLFRVLDANNFLFVRMYGGNVELLKQDGGVPTSLGTTAQATTDSTDYIIKVVTGGNQVEVFVDGVSKILVTLSGGDTKYAAYTKYGMRLVTGGAPSASARWDDFKVQGSLP